MTSSTIITQASATESSSALLSGEKLEHRLEELLHQERFAPPPQLVASESVDDSLAARPGRARSGRVLGRAGTNLNWDEPLTTVLDDLTSEGPPTPLVRS
jgi:hypothetical protein